MTNRGSTFDADTSLARGERRFPSTCWTALLEGASAPGAVAPAYLESLARRYWRPVYAYVRTRWSHTNEDAKDLTQEFFVWILESGLIGRADPARGRFRALVKVALERFLTDAARRRSRRKRGGDRTVTSLAAPDEGGRELELPDPRGRRPEEILDDAWRREIVQHAVQALEDGYRCEGRPLYYAVFRDYFLSDEGLSYAQVAARHGLSRADVSNYLMHAKRRYRRVLRQAVADTVEGTDALQQELDWLFERVGP